VSGDLQPRVHHEFRGTNRPVVVNGRAAYLAAMTDRTPPADSLDQTLADLAEDFDLLGDWEQRIEYVIELGKGLAPLDAADRVEANKVPGCAAQVWLAVHPAEGRLWFDADSDSALSKGNIALLLKLYSGRTPAEILAFDARAALDRLGLAHQKVGEVALPEGERHFPTFRMPIRDKQGDIVYWWFWDGHGLSYSTELDATQETLPMREVMSSARLLRELQGAA